tara:strand:- start:363 stop:554 length:192 start_codon:yes stop_codon:yes gene_type:complete
VLSDSLEPLTIVVSIHHYTGLVAVEHLVIIMIHILVMVVEAVEAHAGPQHMVRTGTELGEHMV